MVTGNVAIEKGFWICRMLELVILQNAAYNVILSIRSWYSSAVYVYVFVQVQLNNL